MAEYEKYEVVSRRAKNRAIELMDQWEKEGLTIREVEATISALKDGMTDAYHKLQRETPFRRVKD